MNLRTKYAALKTTTVVLGAFSIPLGTFVGFSLGQQDYVIALVALGGQTVLALVDGYIWFWVLENLRCRIEELDKRPPNGTYDRDIPPYD